MFNVFKSNSNLMTLIIIFVLYTLTLIYCMITRSIFLSKFFWNIVIYFLSLPFENIFSLPLYMKKIPWQTMEFLDLILSYSKLPRLIQRLLALSIVKEAKIGLIFVSL